jgi:hypothetical protein
VCTESQQCVANFTSPTAVPYHLQRIQGLSATDFPPRVKFCQWVQQQSVLNPPFLSNILFTDETGFTRDSIFNYHNCYVCCDENSHTVHESRYHQRFSLIIDKSTRRLSNLTTHSSKQANRKAVPPVHTEYSSRPPWGCSPSAKSEHVVYAWWCTSIFCSSCEMASKLFYHYFWDTLYYKFRNKIIYVYILFRPTEKAVLLLFKILNNILFFWSVIYVVPFEKLVPSRALILLSWRWRWYISPKRRLTFNGLHDVISQKTVLFITTAVTTSNPRSLT